MTNKAVDNSGNSSNAEIAWGGNGSADGYVGKATLTKVDANDSNTKLAGAEFEVINKDNNNKVIRSGLVTDSDGKLVAENLPKGHYAFVETKAPAGYLLDSTEQPFTITGDKDEENTVEITVADTHVSTTSLTVKKVWNDNNDQAGKQPESIQVQLYQNDEAFGDPVTLTATGNWTYTWKDLATEDQNGQPITYKVEEVNVPENYTSSAVTNGNVVTITNTYNQPQPTTTSATVKKVWDDNDNQDGLRPDSVTVELLADGKATGQKVVLSAVNNWTATVTGLDLKANGQVIDYTWQEANVPDGYTSTVDGDGITNTHVPATTAVSVKKVWNDSNNQDNLRPDQVTVELLANGQVIRTVTLNAANDWSTSFDNLAIYNNYGQKIVYTVKKVNVPSGYTSTVTSDGNDFVITNTHTPIPPTPVTPD